MEGTQPAAAPATGGRAPGEASEAAGNSVRREVETALPGLRLTPQATCDGIPTYWLPRDQLGFLAKFYVHLGYLLVAILAGGRLAMEGCP